MKKNTFILLFLLCIFNKVFAQIPVFIGAKTDDHYSPGYFYKINGDGLGYGNIYNCVDSTGFCINRGFVKNVNGLIYGLTNYGGIGNAGVLYSFNPVDSSFSKLQDLGTLNGGWGNAFMIASNGLFYGTVFHQLNTLQGTMFCYNPIDSSFGKVYSFPNAAPDFLMEASNGKIYGILREEGGPNNAGGIFCFNQSDSSVTYPYSFKSDYDMGPQGLTEAPNGKLYGVLRIGNDSTLFLGMIFSLDLLTNEYTEEFSFGTTAWKQPVFPLTLYNGLLYGVTYCGNSCDDILFSFDPINKVFQKLAEFSTIGSSEPVGSLTLADDNNLYAVMREGGTLGCGVICAFNPSTNLLSKFYDFKCPIGNYVRQSTELIQIGTYSPTSIQTTTTFPPELIVSPNPANKEFTLNYKLNHSFPVLISIKNIEGKVLYEKINSTKIGENVNTISTIGMSSGIYFISINSKEGSTIKKIIIQ